MLKHQFNTEKGKFLWLWQASITFQHTTIKNCLNLRIYSYLSQNRPVTGIKITIITIISIITVIKMKQFHNHLKTLFSTFNLI